MTAYRTAGPQVSWEEFDAEYVVLELETGRYFNLAGGAALLWKAILAGADIAELAAGLAPSSAEQAALQACLAGLIAANLIVEAAEVAECDPALAGQIAASGSDYRLEAYDDLANLLAADPIHDVQAEAGWPHLPS